MMTLQTSTFLRRFTVGFAAMLLQLALHAQGPAPSPSRTVEATITAGIGSDFLSGDLGVRYNPHPNVSLEAEVGGGRWKRDINAAAAQRLPSGITEGTLQSDAMYGLRLKFYSGREHTGAFGGIGVVQQGYKINVNSRFARPQAPGAYSTGQGVIGFIVALFSGSGRSYDSYATEATGTVRGLNLTGGYAMAFSGGQRVEVGLNYVARAFGDKTFTYGTQTGAKELRLDDHFGSNSLRLEIKYVVPLFR